MQNFDFEMVKNLNFEDCFDFERGNSFDFVTNSFDYFATSFDFEAVTAGYSIDSGQKIGSNLFFGNETKFAEPQDKDFSYWTAPTCHSFDF